MPETDKPQRDYRGTVNLPKTDFPMKGNLQQLEPKMLSFWEEKQLFARLLERNSGKPLYVLHDGPPYANGHLHAGHALNKILKDIVVKYRNMAGSLCDFVPGWDCHGLPIEQAVEKRLRDRKVDRRALGREDFLAKCREYALEFVDIQREEFKRMGVLGRWAEPYLTLSFDYEAQELRELASFARQGFIYRKKKPVYWCIVDATALAEAEVEYEDHESPSIHVAFDTAEDLGKRWPQLAGKKVAFAIWTTTPWTLPANLAIAVHPELDYVFYELGPRVLCVAKELLGRFLADIRAEGHLLRREVAVPKPEAEAAAKLASLPPEKLGGLALADPTRILAYAKGAELEGLTYRHAFYDRVSPILPAEHVTLEQGTGLVHTAPGHGQEDYELGLSRGLDIYNPVKNDGRFDETVGPLLAGKKVFEANALVVDLLVEKGALLNRKGESLKHSYPHCWRCHEPVIFRATHQWFISLEANRLRQRALEEIDRVKWVPRWGRERIYGMLTGRPDWCISRQRTWGVPIPVAVCERCNEPLVSAELMEKVAQAVEKEGGGVWYREPLERFLPEGHACRKCGGRAVRKETDILDVWFDSACSFAAVAARRPNMKVPVDLYLEGSDQHRGWFHSSLLVGVGTRGRSPYETCLTHGFVVDGEGRKMSKSLGNVVSPEQIIKQYGAEVMRLWVASSDYRDDVRLSDQILKGLSEGYRKIRNTIRYALGNLYDFDPEKDAVPEGELLPLDRWAKGRLDQLVQKVRAAYEEYELHIVYHAVVDFCAMDLSAVYFDILKDRLYTAKASGRARRSAQTVLHQVARELLCLLAPVMSFTAEEAYQLLPGKKEASVFLAGFPEVKAPADPELMDTFEKLFAVRSEVQKLLEGARRDKLIGASADAKLVLSARGPAEELLRKNLSAVAALFIVSQVELVTTPSAKAQRLSLPAFASSEVLAEVLPADGQKCPRCWLYAVEVGKEAPVCRKCAEALA
ncbi:MAG: isoleucine--tRNA ligase [Myxococcales bacterium]|nr:isoleucine--tRNA ligase [Myxococcales bacterium]